MQRIPDFSSARKETVDILVTSRNQPSKFTSAVGNCQGFCRGKQCLNSNHLGKNITEVIISSKLYIQFTIFNTFFSINFVYRQEISLAHTREVFVCATKSQIYYILLAVYSSPFSSFAWQWNKLCFLVVYYRIDEILRCHIFKQLLFCFIFLPFVHLMAPKKDL